MPIMAGHLGGRVSGLRLWGGDGRGEGVRGDELAVGFGHAVVPAGKGVRQAFDCLRKGVAPPGRHCRHFDRRWLEGRKGSKGDVEVKVSVWGKGGASARGRDGMRMRLGRDLLSAFTRIGSRARSL